MLNKYFRQSYIISLNVHFFRMMISWFSAWFVCCKWITSKNIFYFYFVCCLSNVIINTQAPLRLSLLHYTAVFNCRSWKFAMRSYQCFLRLYKMLLLYTFFYSQSFEQFMTNSIKKMTKTFSFYLAINLLTCSFVPHTHTQTVTSCIGGIRSYKWVSRENFIFTFHLWNIFVSAALRHRYVKFIVTCAHIRKNGNFSTLLIFYFI